jgi:hypothetical protein
MKRLLNFFVAVCMTASVLAEGHMKFKGVEIDGTPKEFVQKMKEKGFTYVKNDEGTEIMLGDFAGNKSCILGIVSSNNKVAKVSVIIPDETSTWSILYNKYITLKEMLTKKYGEPTIDKEEWQSYSAPRDDNSKMHELKMNRATIGAYYEMPEGSIEISLFSMQMECCVLISYYDAVNHQSAINNAMEDL